MKEIYLAGGCFWGVEEYFSHIKGVFKTSVGYANGNSTNPTYENIKLTNHAEVVYIQYDPKIVGLEFILDMYFKIIDPLSKNKQGGDVGTQYRTGIYYIDESDFNTINRCVSSLENQLGQKTCIEVEKLFNYADAEDYHQDYLKKNIGGYCHLGSDKFEDAKNATPIADLKHTLTTLEYEVTQNSATEPPFKNEFWDHYKDGIYIDKITGEPLFTSIDKFACAGGWPSFSKPISKDIVDETLDTSHGMIRTEVKSKLGKTHLGHVFNDGPAKLGGNRYCINSASLKFIPKEQLAENGFSEYLKLFDK